MCTLSFLVFVAWLSVAVSREQINICGNDIGWKNCNTECLPYAVCGDAHYSVRQLPNLTTCEERHYVSHCICPGMNGGTCPFDNPTYELHALSTHRMYTCEPKCNIFYCLSTDSIAVSNYTRIVLEINTWAKFQRLISIPSDITGKEVLYRDSIFSNKDISSANMSKSLSLLETEKKQLKSYLRQFEEIIDCRFPRHHVPREGSQPEDESVTLRSSNRFFVNYMCQNTQSEWTLSDPCEIN